MVACTASRLRQSVSGTRRLVVPSSIIGELTPAQTAQHVRGGIPSQPFYGANIRTLNPHKLEPGDIIELRKPRSWVYDRHYLEHREKPTKGGAVWRPRPGIPPDEWKQAKICLLYTAASPRSRHIPFPPNTRGWFYYNLPPHRPAVAGEVRFRRASASTTAPPTFESGSDLLLPSGSPFCIPLVLIAGGSIYTMLREVLLRDGLVAPDLMEHCRRIHEKELPLHRTWRDRQFLSSLKDPIVFNLARFTTDLRVWVNDELHSVRVTGRFGHMRLSGRMKATPYEGVISARLERSTLPQHSGSRVLLVRIVKILQPVGHILPGYDGALEEPVEGELLKRRGRPVGILLDGPEASTMIAPLRILYDQDAASQSLS